MKSNKDKNLRDTLSDEQRICIKCGLCCDGTLFLKAHLGKNERGSLPEWIEQNRITEEEKEYFRLPCGYFEGYCTIYGLKRADICFSFRCTVLNSYRAGRISLDDACRIVTDAVSMRDLITENYRKISGRDSGIPFRKLLTELVNNEISEPAYDLFCARCNIFEALLIRFFRSEKEFKDIMEE